MMWIRIIVLLLISYCCILTLSHSQPIIEDPDKRLTLIEEYNGCRLWWAERKHSSGAIDADNAHYFLQLKGSYYDRGYAYGYLMADQILSSAKDVFDFAASSQGITQNDLDTFMTTVFTNLPTKYQNELNGYLAGIQAKRGTLAPMDRASLLLVASSITAPTIGEFRSPYIQAPEVQTEPVVASTVLSVWGDHTRYAPAAGDVLTLGSPGFPGISENVEHNRVVIAFQSSPYPEEVDYAVMAFAGNFGIYSVAFNEDGITLSGCSAAVPFLNETTLTIDPAAIAGGWMPLAFLTREIISRPDNAHWKDHIEILLKTHQQHLVFLHLARGTNDRHGPDVFVYESGSNKIQNFPKSVELHPGWATGIVNLNWLGDYLLAEGDLYRIGAWADHRIQLLHRSTGSEVGHVNIENYDREGMPLSGRISLPGQPTRPWSWQTVGQYWVKGQFESTNWRNDFLPINTNQAGDAGYLILNQGTDWGYWRTNGTAMTVYNSKDELIASGQILKNGPVLVYGDVHATSNIDFQFMMFKQRTDDFMLNSDNIVNNLTLRGFLKTDWIQAGNNFRTDNRHQMYLDALSGHQAIQPVDMLAIFREMVTSRNFVTQGDHFGLNQLLPLTKPLAGKSLGIGITSAKHKEFYVQFGRVYAGEGYAPAINLRRKPIKYTSHDLFSQPTSTRTPTATPTASWTTTPTATTVASTTATPTTTLALRTLTATPTASHSVTMTGTATPQPTLTMTATPSINLSSGTFTPTQTTTITQTPSCTSTVSITASGTPKPSSTVTPLFTFTPSIVATATVTATPTLIADFFQNHQVLAFPQPAQDKLYLKVKISGPAVVDITLYNMAGERVLMDKRHLSSSSGQGMLLQLNTTKVSSGLYLLHLEIDDRTGQRPIRKKIVISQ